MRPRREKAFTTWPWNGLRSQNVFFSYQVRYLANIVKIRRKMKGQQAKDGSEPVAHADEEPATLLILRGPGIEYLDGTDKGL